MKPLSSYIQEDSVCFVTANSKSAVLQEMVDQLASTGVIHDSESFYSALLKREELLSTAIGLGIAIPHAKFKTDKDFFIAIGVHRTGIDWDALDQLPVQLIFLIGGPESRQTEYLQLLAQLTNTIKEEGVRKKLLQLNSAKEILEIFQGN